MPGEKEEGIFEMLGNLVTDGLTKIFRNDHKQDEDDEDDEEADYEEEASEVRQAESGNGYKVGHADSGAVAIEEDAQRALGTGNVVTECMLVKSCLKCEVSTHIGHENGTDSFFL